MRRTALLLALTALSAPALAAPPKAPRRKRKAKPADQPEEQA